MDILAQSNSRQDNIFLLVITFAGIGLALFLLNRLNRGGGRDTTDGAGFTSDYSSGHRAHDYSPWDSGGDGDGGSD